MNNGSFYILQTRDGAWSPSETFNSQFEALEGATQRLVSMATQRPPLSVDAVPVAVAIYNISLESEITLSAIGLNREQTAQVFTRAQDDFYNQHVVSLQSVMGQRDDLRQERDALAKQLAAAEVVKHHDAALCSLSEDGIEDTRYPSAEDQNPVPAEGWCAADRDDAQRTGDEPV